jgi:glutaredoxin-like protein DUF836
MDAAEVKNRLFRQPNITSLLWCFLMTAKTFNRQTFFKIITRHDWVAMLYLYGTSSCHLCEEASTLLADLNREFRFDWIEMDIAEDESLLLQYGLKIPVLLDTDCNIELCWPFSSTNIRNLLVLRCKEK